MGNEAKIMDQPQAQQPSAPGGDWDPKLQTPEARKALVEYAKAHGIKPAMRHFGCSRNTIRKWLRRFETEGHEGLKGLPRGRRPKAKAAAPVKPQVPSATRFPWPAMPAKQVPSPSPSLAAPTSHTALPPQPGVNQQIPLGQAWNSTAARPQQNPRTS